MHRNVLILHKPVQALQPVVLDSPHSGYRFPTDFDAALSEFDLRDGEDCFIDELWLPATTKGIPLLAAQFPRTYLDPNRHAGDIDLALLNTLWPHAHQPSGKASIGKALIWRTLDDGRPIYTRPLTVAEVAARIERYHRPYHQALRELMDTAHAQFGQVFHINCHSMNAVSGTMGEGGAGQARADVVLGDRDGTTCAPAFTAFVRDELAAKGYDVKVNDPFKGVELVRAYSNPAAGRHSLQLEVNKRLYMDEATRQRHDGYARLQADLMALLDAITARFGVGWRPERLTLERARRAGLPCFAPCPPPSAFRLPAPPLPAQSTADHPAAPAPPWRRKGSKGQAHHRRIRAEGAG